jgi:hypothetical protein
VVSIELFQTPGLGRFEFFPIVFSSNSTRFRRYAEKKKASLVGWHQSNQRAQVHFEETCPSVNGSSLEAVTSDKPLVDSFASRLFQRPDEEDEVETQLRETLGLNTRDLPESRR